MGRPKRLYPLGDYRLHIGKVRCCSGANCLMLIIVARYSTGDSKTKTYKLNTI